MGTFREYGPEGRDRSAGDRRRHRELVEDSIKKNIGNIIAEESIIGQAGSKKIKIPIRSIREYRFVYGKNSHTTGSGDGDEKRGDIIGEDAADGRGTGQGPGNQEGEDVYETEITIDELTEYLLEDLRFPEMDRKKSGDLAEFISLKKSGYKKKGAAVRLAKKRSAIERIKRRKASARNAEANEPQEAVAGRFPFMEEDLRYHRLRENGKRGVNAVVFCIMDVSGSMDQTRKYMARSFYFLLYQFIRLSYSHVEVVFISHTTTAKEVSERDFFHRGESGGTYISSGYEKALEIVGQRYHPDNWNIYVFHCSDGDNWTEDNRRAIDMAVRLCGFCSLFGYGEIVPGYYASGNTIKSEFMKHIKEKNFIPVTISKREDVLEGLRKMLSGPL